MPSFGANSAGPNLSHTVRYWHERGLSAAQIIAKVKGNSAYKGTKITSINNAISYWQLARKNANNVNQSGTNKNFTTNSLSGVKKTTKTIRVSVSAKFNFMGLGSIKKGIQDTGFTFDIDIDQTKGDALTQIRQAIIKDIFSTYELKNQTNRLKEITFKYIEAI